MRIAFICCTYKRPVQLANVIACYLAQDYPAKLCELVILDDAGQYKSQCGQKNGRRWRLVSTTARWPTLGEKRNASAALASADVEAFAVCDDDDAYLPGHLSATARALVGVDYAIPSRVLVERRASLAEWGNRRLFHGGWGFTRQAFNRVGQYPPEQSGQDASLLRNFKAAHLRRGDNAAGGPTYIYRWRAVPRCYHISARPKSDGYETLAARPAAYVGRIAPRMEREWANIPRK